MNTYRVYYSVKGRWGRRFGGTELVEADNAQAAIDSFNNNGYEWRRAYEAIIEQNGE